MINKKPTKKSSKQKDLKRKAKKFNESETESESDEFRDRNYFKRFLGHMMQSFNDMVSETGAHFPDPPKTVEKTVETHENTNDEPVAGPSNLNSEPVADMENFFDDIESEIIGDEEDFEYECPPIFSGESKFDEAIDEKLANIVNEGCRKKGEITDHLERNKIPMNCKALVPPNVNDDIWPLMSKQVQSRDYSLKEVQKLMGVSLVPTLKLAKMLKAKNFDVKEARKLIIDAVVLTCSSIHELSTRRKHFLRPSFSKRYQQLFSEGEIEGEFLFCEGISKRIKEIYENSRSNARALKRGGGYYYGPKNWPRGRGQGRGRSPRGRGRHPRSRGQRGGRYPQNRDNQYQY